MLYYYLAESLSELDMLTYLIKKLEVTDAPIIELMSDTFLKHEIRRIKERASLDILIFGSHSDIYFSKNMTEINRLILHLLELLKSLPEYYRMNEKERYLFTYGRLLKNELVELSAFFSDLRDAYEDPDE